MKRRILRMAAALAIAGIAALAVLLAVLAWSNRTEVILPLPSGKFAVGRVAASWVDRVESDPFAEAPGRPRELAAWVWYPAARTEAAQRAEYLPKAWRDAWSRDSSRLLSAFVTRGSGLVRTHSLAGAPVAPDQPRYPVVILRAGLSALSTSYTVMAEDLASHGYIVVGFDAPYRTLLVVLQDGQAVWRPAAHDPEAVTGEARDRLLARLLRAWVSDIGFAAEQLERWDSAEGQPFHARLDLGALGVAGHSLGGAAAAQFCQQDPRCRAGIDMDGAPLGSGVRRGLSRPFLFLLSDHRGEQDPVSRQIHATVRSLGGTRLAIRGANHFTFSDQMVVANPALAWLLGSAGILGIEPGRGLAAASQTVRRFFDVHLKGAPPGWLEGLTADYPEVQVEAR